MKRRDFLAGSSVALSAALFPSWKGYSADSNIPLEIQAVTGNKKEFLINRNSIIDLKQSIKGRILLPSDDEYHVIRLVRNRSIDKKPAFIVQCVDETDIQKAVNFARSYDMLTSVKCGGHSVSGKGTCNKGLMIDLSPFRGNRLDKENKRLFIIDGYAT